MGYLMLGALALILTLGGVAKCEHQRAETAVAESEAKDVQITGFQNNEKRLVGQIGDQNESIKKLAADAQRRIAAAVAARKTADAEREAAEEMAAALLAEKPSNPEDPCKSACSVLRSPF